MTGTLGRSAASGASATFGWQLIKMVLLASSVVILARLLDAADYGLLAMVTSIIGIGELVRDFGLSMAAVQSRVLTSGEKNNLFWANAALGMTLSVLCFFLSWPIAQFYGDSRLVIVTQALAVTFLLNGLAAQFKAQLNRDLRFLALGMSEVVPQALALTVAVAFALVGAGYWALVAQALVLAVSALLMTVALARWWPGLPDRTSSLRRFLRFGGALSATQALAYVSKNVDNVLLGVLFGPTLLGLYSRAYQIVVLPISQITSPMSRVAVPVLSRLHHSGESDRYARFLEIGQFFAVTAATVVYGFIVGFATPIVGILLGPDWYAVVPILQALALSGIFRVLGQVPYWLFISKGQAGAQLKYYLFGQPVLIACIAIGALSGAVGVAWGATIGYFLFWIGQMWWAGRVMEVSPWRLSKAGVRLVLVLGSPIVAIGFLTTRDGLPWWVTGAGMASSAVITMVSLWFIPRYRKNLRDLRRNLRS